MRQTGFSTPMLPPLFMCRSVLRPAAGRRGISVRQLALAAATLLLCTGSMAQVGQVPRPAVGVFVAEFKPMAESTEINGRIQARDRVDLGARVTAFLIEQVFVDGAEIKKDDMLYRLERAPFEADVELKQAAIAQAEAQLENANAALERAEELSKRGAGTEVSLDNARATQQTSTAQLKAAQAQRRQSQINLDYTEIRAPIDGRIGRTSITVGNIVSPTSGVLATIVSADPMYVVFSVSVRRIFEFRDRYAEKGGLDALQIRIRLPNGRMYDQIGKLDFADVRVAKDTDTIVLRGTISNPIRPSKLRELVDDMFVAVLLEAIEPLKVLAVPRVAILSDQQGDYLYVVNDRNIVEQRRVKLASESTPETAAVAEGLKQGERVVVEGIQRVRPNAIVSPAPARDPP
jgi:membrane fusion protein (multidrug efflux system)